MPNSREALSEERLISIARRFAVLSEPMRLRLLHVLMEGEQSVNALAGLTGGTQANISRHLQTLAEAGMVGRRKHGLRVFYNVSDNSIYKLCELVCGSLEKHHSNKASVLRRRRKS